MNVILLCPQSNSIFFTLVNNSVDSQPCSVQNTSLKAPRTPDFSTLCKGAPGKILFCPPGPASPPPPSECRIWLKTLPWLICRLSLSNTWLFFANYVLSWCYTGLLVHGSHRKSHLSLWGAGTPLASQPFWPLTVYQAYLQSQSQTPMRKYVIFFSSQLSSSDSISTNGRKMINLENANSRQFNHFKWYMQFLRVLLPVPFPSWCSSSGFMKHSDIGGRWGKVMCHLLSLLPNW